MIIFNLSLIFIIILNKKKVVQKFGNVLENVILVQIVHLLKEHPDVVNNLSVQEGVQDYVQ